MKPGQDENYIAPPESKVRLTDDSPLHHPGIEADECDPAKAFFMVLPFQGNSAALFRPICQPINIQQLLTSSDSNNQQSGGLQGAHLGWGETPLLSDFRTQTDTSVVHKTRFRDLGSHLIHPVGPDWISFKYVNLSDSDV